MSTITQTDLGGTGRYIRFDQGTLDNLGAQTHVAYVRPYSAGGGGFGYLYGKTGSNNTTGPRFYLGAGGANGVGFGAASTGGAFPLATSAGDALTYNAWQHLAFTWDGTVSASGIEIFINAVAVTSAASRQNGSGTVASDASNNAFLMNRNGLGREFVGNLAYYAIWSRVLSAEELATVQTSGPLSVPSGLVLLYANQQDNSPSALAVSARSAYAAGDLPPNTALGGGSDETAPTLTSPSASATGATTAVGSVTTDEANGTLYWLASANASETAATVKAGSSQSVSASGSQSVSLTGLTASTSYYLHFVHRDAAGNDSSVATSAQFTTSAEDTTPPTLTGPSATATGTTTASGTVSTNEATGTLYWVASANASESAATVKAGSSQAVSATGTQTVSVSGLTASTSYYLHYLHRDGAGNDSDVASSAQFTTAAESVVVKGATITLYYGDTPQASVSGIRALWWDATAPDATAPDFYTATASTDASGAITLDLDAATALDVGDYGYLVLHKDGTLASEYRDALAFQGAVQITDIG